MFRSQSKQRPMAVAGMTACMMLMLAACGQGEAVQPGGQGSEATPFAGFPAEVAWQAEVNGVVTQRFEFAARDWTSWRSASTYDAASIVDPDLLAEQLADQGFFDGLSDDAAAAALERAVAAFQSEVDDASQSVGFSCLVRNAGFLARFREPCSELGADPILTETAAVVWEGPESQQWGVDAFMRPWPAESLQVGLQGVSEAGLSHVVSLGFRENDVLSHTNELECRSAQVDACAHSEVVVGPDSVPLWMFEESTDGSFWIWRVTAFAAPSVIGP